MDTHILVERQSNIVEIVCHQPVTVLGTWPDNHNLATRLRHTLHLRQPSFASLLRLSGKGRAGEGDVYTVLCHRKCVEAPNKRDNAISMWQTCPFTVQDAQQRGRWLHCIDALSTIT